MTELLANHVAAAGNTEQGPAPNCGTLCWAPPGAGGRHGVEPARGLRICPRTGGAALRAATYRERATMRARSSRCCRRTATVTTTLPPPTPAPSRRTLRWTSTAIFTLGQYARWGDALGDVRVLRDGDAVRLGKDPVFQSQHLQVPRPGVALCINAFNFPAWGLWEKPRPPAVRHAGHRQARHPRRG